MKLKDIRNTPLENLVEDLFLKTDPLRFCIMLFVISRLLIFFLYWYGNIIYPPGPPSFILNFLRWDSPWYIQIANQGYSASTNYLFKQPVAYFPLYPLLMHILSLITSWPAEQSGLVISNVFFFLALYYLHRLLRDIGVNQVTTRLTLLLLALSPGNIYFTSVYTESLFLGLSVMSMAFAYRSQWLAASIAAGFLSATHPNGVFIILPLLLVLIKEYKATRTWKYAYCSMLLVPSGLLLYMLYLHNSMGDALAFFHAQSAWSRTGWQWGHLWVQFRDLYIYPNYGTPIEILFILALAVLYKRKYYIEFAFMLVLIAPAFLSGASVAFSRFVEAFYPFYMGLGLFVQDKKYYPILPIILFSLLLGVNILGWLIQAWLV